MASFDPLTAALGGALIGLATVLLLVLIGRVAGISGIFADLIAPAGRDRGWRIAFLLGLIAAPLALAVAGRPAPLPAMPDWTVIVAAGLLVGYGTRLGGGCTSGHGICGFARFSPRSITATLIFMATAILVVAVTRHAF
jgi:uncharacterized membrane protein YedE/YeeE